MKQCPNCGAVLRGGTKFCPKCGADLSIDPSFFEGADPDLYGAPEAGMGTRPRRRRLAKVLVPLILAGGIAGVGIFAWVYGRPAANSLMVTDAIERTAEGYAACAENSWWASWLQGGSAEFSLAPVSGDSWNNLIPMEGGLKLYSDRSQKQWALESDLTWNGEPMTRLSAYARDSELALTLPGLSSSYGLNMAQAAQRLSESALAPQSGSLVSLDKDSYDRLYRLLHYTEGLGEDTDKLKEFGRYAVELVYANCEIEQESDTCYVSGKDVDVSKICIYINETQTAEIMAGLLEKAAEDEDTWNALCTMTDLIGLDTERLKEYRAQWESDPNAFRSAVMSEGTEVYLYFSIGKATHCLVSVDLCLYTAGESTYMTLSFGADPRQYIDLRFSAYDYEDLDLDFQFSDLDDGYGPETELQLSDGKDVDWRVTVEYEPDDSTFDFTVWLDSGYFCMEGTYTDNGSVILAQADSAYSTNGYWDMNGTITLRREDAMPDMPEYKNLLDMDAGDWLAAGTDLLINGAPEIGGGLPMVIESTD